MGSCLGDIFPAICPHRHSDAGRKPDPSLSLVRQRFAGVNAEEWVPACAGMTRGVGKRREVCGCALSLLSSLTPHSSPLTPRSDPSSLPMLRCTKRNTQL